MKTTTFTRWMKFNAAGVLGVGVQIATLAALTQFAGINYLAATAFAVEAAILHNFIWHERYTWADRTRFTPQLAWKRLLHFNLSNGAVSLVGNLALMKLLVDYTEVPALLANLIAIAGCSTANFFVAEFLVFSNQARKGQARESDDQLFI